MYLDDILKYKKFNELKKVYRFNSVDDRKESSAEHSWGCLILADFLISKLDLKLDRLKVYELLMYHDVIEIEVGDSPLHPKIDKKNKEQKEREAKFVLKDKFPKPLDNKFLRLFLEFEEQKTIESKFAKAVDALEAEIHELDYKKDWEGWTEKFLVDSKLKYFKEFPDIEKIFFELMDYLKKNNYFDNIK